MSNLRAYQARIPCERHELGVWVGPRRRSGGRSSGTASWVTGWTQRNDHLSKWRDLAEQDGNEENLPKFMID